MEAFALYLLKSVIWLTGFALVYFIFLRNERFFRLKRYFLIAGILVSFIFPLFTFHYQVEMSATQVNPVGITPSEAVATTTVQPVLQHKSFDYRYVLLLLYLAGIIFLAFRAIKNIGVLLKTINKTKINYRTRAKLVRTPEFSGSFSFFNYVFINPEVDGQEFDVIVNHELVHVNQKHWLDLLLVELLRMVQWVNPFVWIYTRFVKQNHEYIADEMMLQQTANPAVYKAVLVNQLFDSRVINLSNSFNYSVNKKRFDMMKKIVTSPYRKMKVLLVLPVFAFVFYAFATPEYKYTAPSGNTVNAGQANITIANSDQDLQQKSVVKIKNSDGSEVKPLIVVDRVISGTKIEDLDPSNIASMSVLKGESAIGKYGEKGKNGVIEITTRKKAKESGLKPEYFPRQAPEDYPTFQNQKWTSFREWVTDQVKYPSEAQAQKIEGWVTVNFTVELDGTISNPVALGAANQVLSGEVIRVIQSAPKWDPPKNPAVDVPFNGSVNVGFKLPDQIEKEEPFVVVEEMPMYPGGEGELLKFLAENTRYPEEAKAQKIEGKVIIRFIVNTDGDSEGISVLKGVHPLLDAEAARVVGMLSGFKPGRQGGKTVPVWYMVPITFVLPVTNQP